MYVAVKGGERAIERSWDVLAKQRRGDLAVPELSVAQIREQMRLAVARVMTEGSVYDEDLAALAIKQAAGDLVEAPVAERDLADGQQRPALADDPQRVGDGTGSARAHAHKVAISNRPDPPCGGPGGGRISPRGPVKIA